MIRDYLPEIESEFRSGLTLQQIGTKYGVTRERVRQVLRESYIPPEAGGARIRRAMRVRRKQAQQDALYMTKHGMNRAAYLSLARSIKDAFQNQWWSARNRGIKWDLSLKEWLDIWNASGKWSERGRHGFCMARINDLGGYVPGNVYITTVAENSREYQRAVKAGRKPQQTICTGIYKQFPGSPRPYLVMAHMKFVGTFATPDEAIAARARALSQ